MLPQVDDLEKLEEWHGLGGFAVSHLDKDKISLLHFRITWQLPPENMYILGVQFGCSFMQFIG